MQKPYSFHHTQRWKAECFSPRTGKGRRWHRCLLHSHSALEAAARQTGQKKKRKHGEIRHKHFCPHSINSPKVETPCWISISMVPGYTKYDMFPKSMTEQYVLEVRQVRLCITWVNSYEMTRKGRFTRQKADQCLPAPGGSYEDY